jgi:hypothetical protein
MPGKKFVQPLRQRKKIVQANSKVQIVLKRNSCRGYMHKKNPAETRDWKKKSCRKNVIPPLPGFLMVRPLRYLRHIGYVVPVSWLSRLVIFSLRPGNLFVALWGVDLYICMKNCADSQKGYPSRFATCIASIADGTKTGNTNIYWKLSDPESDTLTLQSDLDVWMIGLNPGNWVLTPKSARYIFLHVYNLILKNRIGLAVSN